MTIALLLIIFKINIMKLKIILTAALISTSYFVYPQKCIISCNLTTAYVCPNSNTWKSNPGIYNDADLMKELGYAKDNKGCWKLSNNNTSATITTTNKPKAQTWWDKIKQAFSGAKKTGF